MEHFDKIFKFNVQNGVDTMQTQNTKERFHSLLQFAGKLWSKGLRPVKGWESSDRLGQT